MSLRTYVLSGARCPADADLPSGLFDELFDRAVRSAAAPPEVSSFVRVLPGDVVFLTPVRLGGGTLTVRADNPPPADAAPPVSREWVRQRAVDLLPRGEGRRVVFEECRSAPDAPPRRMAYACSGDASWLGETSININSEVCLF